MRLRFSTVMFLGCLLTLPWVGVGLIHLLSGRDVGGGLQPSWSFLALAIFFLFGEKLRSGQLKSSFTNIFNRPSPLLLISGASLLAVVLSGVGLYLVPSVESMATGLGRWTRQIIQLIVMFSFVWWAALWVRGTRRWQLTMDFLFLGVIVQVLYSFAQGIDFYFPSVWFSWAEGVFTSNPSILSGSEKLYLNNVLQEIPRLRGTVCEPLYLGNFILMVWPFLMVWRRPAALRLALGFLLFLLLVLTWSRGAWLGFLAQLFLLALVFVIMRSGRQALSPNPSHGKRLKYLPWLFFGFLVVVSLVDRVTGGWILQRLMATFNNQDWSNLTRLYSMKAAWLGFLQSPIVGLGWGQFAFHFPLLVDPMGLQSQFSWPVVNNFPLKVLCETGLVGFGGLMATGLYLIRRVWLVQVQQSHFLSSQNMVLPAAVGVWGVWTQLFSFSQYNLPHIWLGIGLLLGALAQAQSFPEKGNKEIS